MSRLRLLWNIMTGADRPTLLRHETRISALEQRVEAVEALHRLTRRNVT